MIPLKICGITNLKDANSAIQYGASLIGFIFFDKSPRFITTVKARGIVKKIDSTVSFVGVFVNEDLDHIHNISQEVGLDFIQLHGDESPEFCNQVRLPVIKAFRVTPNFDYNLLDRYDVHSFLFDTYKKGQFGGTGNTFNWNLVNSSQNDIPIILSGGLNAKNIKNGISKVSPACVDVNSGVESSPGIKDNQKMKDLYNILKNLDTIENLHKA